MDAYLRYLNNSRVRKLTLKQNKSCLHFLFWGAIIIALFYDDESIIYTDANYFFSDERITSFTDNNMIQFTNGMMADDK